MVSENVSIRSSVVRLIENAVMTGGIMSGMKIATWRPFPSMIGVLLFPLMSSTVAFVITK